MTDAESRVAIVTGASRGIGLAIAQALVDRGDRVCITGRNADTLTEATAGLGPVRSRWPARHTTRPTGRRRSRARWRSSGASTIWSTTSAPRRCSGRCWTTTATCSARCSTSMWSPPSSGSRRCTGVARRPRRGDRQRRLGGGPAPGPGSRRVRREQGRPALPHRAVGGRARARGAGQRRRAGGGEDEVRRGPVRGTGGAGGRDATRPAASAYRPTSAAVAFLLSDEASWITGHTLVLDGGSTLVGALA